MTQRSIYHITGANPWTVSAAGAAPRVLGGIPTELGLLPLPPDNAVAVDALVAALDRFERNAAQGADGPLIGRYLLSCLIDEDTRHTLFADQDDLHIVVATSDEAAALQRLPWELMNDGHSFLALRRRPTVAISRSVGPPPPEATASVNISSRVLVAIGTTLDDPTIQPAAEYLALLDTVRRERLGMEASVIVNANRDDLADACRIIQPDVVHLIAHGEQLANGSSYVELAARPGSQTRSDKISGEQLINILSAAPLPKVLVLTACRTAASQLLANAAGGAGIVTFRPSLAADCVRLGVPIVAAMTGTIASRACREFTLTFYGALFAGRNVVQAAAAGRREAYLDADGVTEEVDWAYPAVFSASGVDGRVDLTITEASQARVARADELLSNYRRPPTFCGRHDVLDKFSRMLTTSSVGSPAVLALCAPTEVPASMKVGTSRTLAELAAAATLAGHCVSGTGLQDGDDRGLDFLTLARRLTLLARRAAQDAGAEVPPTAQVALLAPQPEPGLDLTIRDLVTMGGARWDSAEVVGSALRFDLAAVGQAIGDGPSPGHGLVVMIDDLHAYGPAVSGLLRTVTSNGLGTSEQRVPFLFSYSAVDDTAGDGAIEAITTFVQRGRAVKLDLKPFETPTAHLAYQQLLLGSDQPLIPAPRYREKVLNRIQETTKGNPIMFLGDALQAVILAFRDIEALQTATDLQRLSELIGTNP